MTAINRTPSASILIVDDTKENALLLDRMLTQQGYKTQSAYSGTLAIQAAHAEPPDMILLDVTMPEMDGYEVCKLLKADSVLKEIPVIFTSIRSETDDKVHAFDVGGVDYITKPFHLDEVYARIHTHLELGRLQRLRADLIHMIIHDLTNPLSIIFGFLNIMDREERWKLSTDNQSLATDARGSADEMLNLIRSILDVSKMAAGEMKLLPEPCALATLIRAVLATTRATTDNRMVTLDLPEKPITVTADVVLIRRVLQNLLSNAFKFTPTDGNIRIAVTPSNGEVRVAVTDTGAGIPPEHHEHIFDKFAQVEGCNNRMGTGLGLTFCKMAVEAHGGRIGLESEEGKGSTFWFALPCGN